MLFFIETDRKRETVRGLRMILKLLHPRLSFLKTAQKDNSEKADFHISFLWPRVYFSSDWVSFGPPGAEFSLVRYLSENYYHQQSD